MIVCPSGKMIVGLRRMIICLRQNKGEFSRCARKLSLKSKPTSAKKFLKILKELFSKSSLSRAPQSAKLPPCFKTAAPLPTYLPSAKADSVSAAEHRRLPAENRQSRGRSKLFPFGKSFAPSPLKSSDILACARVIFCFAKLYSCFARVIFRPIVRS